MLLESNNAKRDSMNTLPSKTFYFSENVLRNRFAKRTKPLVEKRSGFRYTSGLFSPPELVYRPESSASEFCLLDDKDNCGCSGAMMEFLITLARKGTRNLILFIPDECRSPVHSSIDAAMSSLVPFDNVIAVWAAPVTESGRVRFSSYTSYRTAEGPPAKRPRAHG